MYIILGLIAAGGVAMYGMALVKAPANIIAPVLMAGFIVGAWLDVRLLLIGWFILAPHYEYTALEGAPNIASNATHNLFIPMMTVATLGHLFLKGRALRIGRESIPLIVFIAYALLSSYLATKGRYDDVRSIFLIYILPFMLYLVAKNIELDGTFFKMLGYACVFHVVALGIGGIQEFITAEPLYTSSAVWSDVGSRRRITGPLSSPIIMGLFATVLLLYLYQSYKLGLLPRPVYRLAGPFAALMIVLTFTRSVWLGGFLTYLYLLARTGEDVVRKLFRVIGFSAVAVVIVALLIVASPGIEERVAEQDNVNFRVVMAQASINMFLDKPFFGWGSGTFDEVSDRYLFDARGVYIVKDTSHVTLFTLLAELGLVGTLPLLVFVVLALRNRGVRLADLAEDDRMIIAVQIGVVIAFVVNAFLIDMKYYPLSYAWLFLSLGIIQNIYNENAGE